MAVRDAAAGGTGSARRRRERRLRAHLRYARMSVAMALAETSHHAAPQGQTKARAGVRGGRRSTSCTPPCGDRSLRLTGSRHWPRRSWLVRRRTIPPNGARRRLGAGVRVVAGACSVLCDGLWGSTAERPALLLEVLPHCLLERHTGSALSWCSTLSCRSSLTFQSVMVVVQDRVLLPCLVKLFKVFSLDRVRQSKHQRQFWSTSHPRQQCLYRQWWSPSRPAPAVFHAPVPVVEYISPAPAACLTPAPVEEYVLTCAGSVPIASASGGVPLTRTSSASSTSAFGGVFLHPRLWCPNRQHQWCNTSHLRQPCPMRQQRLRFLLVFEPRYVVDFFKALSQDRGQQHFVVMIFLFFLVGDA